jgi:hypothetical protein
MSDFPKEIQVLLQPFRVDGRSAARREGALMERVEVISFPLSIAPLRAKHYGTIILDSNGNQFITLWTASGNPSEREIAKFGKNYSEEAWREYISDSHWECDSDYKTALKLVEILNREQASFQQ